MECVRLRVKDIDLGYLRITVRDGKGGKDRVTMLPVNLAKPLERHLQKVRAQHEEDVEAGFGSVFLPNAMARKYPRAAKEWVWQYAFLLLVYHSIRVLQEPRNSDIISMKLSCRTR
jgi:integrase